MYIDSSMLYSSTLSLSFRRLNKVGEWYNSNAFYLCIEGYNEKGEHLLNFKRKGAHALISSRIEKLQT